MKLIILKMIAFILNFILLKEIQFCNINDLCFTNMLINLGRTE